MKIATLLGSLLSGFLLFCANVAPIAVAVGYSSPAVAACSVGGDNQRPCRIWERIPSCNKGLVEDFNRDRCVRPEQHSFYKVCGGNGMRPCTVAEAFPSCHPGLIENFGNPDRCVPRNNQCGALNAEPCLLTERIPSCDRGLAEDFINNRCVLPASGRAICEGVVSAIKAGTLPAGFQHATSYLQKVQKDRGGAGVELQREFDAMGVNIAPIVREAKRLAAIVESPAFRQSLEDIFSASSLCGDPALLKAKLQRHNLIRTGGGSPGSGAGDLRAPAQSIVASRTDREGANPADAALNIVDPIRPNGRVYLSIAVSASIVRVVGVAGGFSIVWDALGKGNPAVFFSVGPAAAFNIAAGAQESVTIYPSMTPKDFPGWFVDGGVSYGELVAGGGSASFTVDPKFQFAGVSLNLGVGASIYPLNLGGSATYSWYLGQDRMTVDGWPALDDPTPRFSN